MDTVDRKVIAFLVAQDWPVTTENVAGACGVTWNTAQLHLYRLMAEGLVRGKKVGRQNQWIVTDEGKRQGRKG